MSVKEQRRVQVMERLQAGQLTAHEAALVLGVSDRQVRRLRDAYMHSGIPGLVHGNKGRTPKNHLSASVVEEALRLCGKDGPYHDFNVCHAHQMLTERHDVKLGRSTLERLLKDSGTRTRKRKRPIVKRCHRERSACAGMMVQVDGSPHDWLEGRAPKMCLMGGIDDATGDVVYARFHKSEDQAGYLLLLRGICTTHGIPMSVYHDKHTILRSPKEPTLEDELAGVKPMSQVQRVMEELGIEAIAAHSPQAKGRVERLWKSLQDRLLKEMRLSGVSSLEEANAFLPAFLVSYRQRFSVAAREETPAWVPLGDDADLARLFSTMELRTVANDHTVSFAGATCLLQRGRNDASLAGRKVQAHVTPEGELRFYDRHTRLAHTVCHDPAPVHETQPVALPHATADIVRLALEHRTRSFHSSRGAASLLRHTAATSAATP